MTGFTLIDPESNRAVRTLASGSEINLAAFGRRRFDIRADTTPGSVGSVRWTFTNGRPRVDNAVPYSLFADDNGDYLGQSLPPGQYTIQATPFSGRNATGAAGQGRSITIKVVNKAITPSPPTTPTPTNVITGLSLLDARDSIQAVNAPPRNTVLRTLASGATLDLASLPTRRLNIRADVAGNAAVRSVRLELDGTSVVRTRSNGLFTLFGDNDPFISPTLFSPGQHSIKVTPFSGLDGTGTAGPSRTFTLKVTDSDGTPLQMFVDFDRDGSLADEAPLGKQVDSLKPAEEVTNEGQEGNEERVSASVYRMLVRNSGSSILMLNGVITSPGSLAEGPRPSILVGSANDVPPRSTVDDTVFVRYVESNPDRTPGTVNNVGFNLFEPTSITDSAPVGRAKRLSPGETVNLTLQTDPRSADESADTPSEFRHGAGQTGITFALAGGVNGRTILVPLLPDTTPPPPPLENPLASASAGQEPAPIVSASGELSAALIASSDISAAVRTSAASEGRLLVNLSGRGSTLNLNTVAGGLYSIVAQAPGSVINKEGQEQEIRTVDFLVDGRFLRRANLGFTGYSLFGTGGLLDNDERNDLAPLSSLRVRTVPARSVSNGTLELFGEGGFTYTPNAGFVGRDSFEYILEEFRFNGDGTTTVLGTSTATVRLNISTGQPPFPAPVVEPPLNNSAPIARDDEFSGLLNQPLVGEGFGSGSGSPTLGALSVGTHTIEVRPVLPDGTAGPSKTFVLTTTRSNAIPSVSGLSLFGTPDSLNDPVFIRSLQSGNTLDLATLATRRLNVNAQIDGDVRSVRFDLDNGKAVRVRNAAPYAFYGDNDAPTLDGLFTPGDHVLRVTPFRGVDATGTAGPTQVFLLKVRDSFNDDGYAFYVDFDDDGSLGDEAALGQQTDELGGGGGLQALASFKNTLPETLVLDGDLQFDGGTFPGFYFRLPSAVNAPTSVFDHGDNTVFVNEEAIQSPDLTSDGGRAYTFFQSTTAGGSAGRPLSLSLGETASFFVVADTTDDDNMVGGGSPRRNRPKPRRRFRARG